MKVLVVGKGGREHSLCWRLNQSPTVWGLYCTGGSPGIDQVAKPVDIAPDDFAALARFAAQEKIDLTVVGPEDPLANGIVDEFERAGLDYLRTVKGGGAARSEQGLRETRDA